MTGTAEPLTVPAHWRHATETTRRSRRVQITSLILVPADRQLTALWELALVTASLERPWLGRVSRSVARWLAHRGW